MNKPGTENDIEQSDMVTDVRYIQIQPLQNGYLYQLISPLHKRSQKMPLADLLLTVFGDHPQIFRTAPFQAIDNFRMI
jgi:hypothetical protein